MARFRYRIWLNFALFLVRQLAAEAPSTTMSLASREKASSCRTALGDLEDPQPRLSMLQQGKSQKSMEVPRSFPAVSEHLEQQKVIPANATTQTPVGLAIARLRSLHERLLAHVDSLSRQQQASGEIVMLMCAVVAMLCVVWTFAPDPMEEYYTDAVMPHAPPVLSSCRLPQQGNMMAPGWTLNAVKSMPVLGAPAPASLAQLQAPTPQQADHWAAASPRTLASSASVPNVVVPSPCVSARSQGRALTPSSRGVPTPPQIPATPELAGHRAAASPSYYQRRTGMQATPPHAGQPVASVQYGSLQATPPLSGRPVASVQYGGPQATPPLSGRPMASTQYRSPQATPPLSGRPLASTQYGGPQAVGHVIHEGQRGNRLLVPRLNLPTNPQ